MSRTYDFICAGCDKPTRRKQTNNRIPLYCNRECWRLNAKKTKSRYSTNYSTLHKRVVSDKGKASSYRCYICDNTALDWATIHDKKGEECDDYIPLCRKCHIEYDNEPGKHSNNGPRYRGEQNSSAKLTKEEVADILYFVDYLPYYVIASIYNVSTSLIGQISTRRIWRHIEPSDLRSEFDNWILRNKYNV